MLPSQFEGLESRRLLSAYTLSDLPLGPSDGANPQCTMVLDAAGNLYGTTQNGGANGAGTVFEVPAGGGTVITLASFGGAADVGVQPLGQLALDPTGDLFGTTNTGRPDSLGTVWELPKGAASVSTLATFNGTNGANPGVGVIIDAAGNLFGVTGSGGPPGGASLGVAWELPKGAGTITVLAPFDVNTGGSPVSLLTDSSGDLFGATGGETQSGHLFVVWEIPRGANAVTTLGSFASDQGTPIGPIAMDAAGNLYGTAAGTGATGVGGTSGLDLIWELSKGGSAVSTLATFTPAIGRSPNGVVIDAAGNLFGASTFGGENDLGAVYELPHGGPGINELPFFSGTDGQNPAGGLVLDSAGNLYGAASAGGSADSGTIFQVSPNGASIAGTPTPTPTPAPAPTPTPTSTSALTPLIERSTLPASVVVGSKVGGAATVQLTNGSATAEKGRVMVRLYASIDGTVDNTSTLLATAARRVSLRPAAKVRLILPVRLVPAGLAAGRYTLVAQVVDPAGQTATGAGPVVTAAAPFVSLSASDLHITPATVRAGGAATLELTLTNGGNVSTSGTAAATVGLSSDGKTSGPALATLAPRPRIRPGGHARVVLHFKLPAAQPAGTYYPFVTLTLDGTTISAIGTTPFTIR